MPEEKKSNSRAILLFILVAPVIVYLLRFAYLKNKNSGPLTEQCIADCEEQGYAGYEFKWAMLSEPVCDCIN